MSSSGPVAPCVVLVESDAAMQALLVEALACVNLRAVGAPWEVARSPDALGAFLLQQQPAALLLDIPPPYASHWQRWRRILRRTPRLPVLVLTTDPTALAGRPGNDGQAPILTKPFEMETLLAAVMRLVHRAPS
jgi:DNA-binding response OmpR family regulator